MWELMKSSVLTLHSVCTKTITRRPRPKIISPQTCWRSCPLVTPRKLSVASTTESICTSGFACLTCRCMSKRAKSMNSSVMWVTFLHPWVFPLKNSCYLPDFFFLTTDFLQRWYELAEGYRLLCLGHSRDPPCQTSWYPSEWGRCTPSKMFDLSFVTC